MAVCSEITPFASYASAVSNFMLSVSASFFYMALWHATRLATTATSISS